MEKDSLLMTSNLQRLKKKFHWTGLETIIKLSPLTILKLDSHSLDTKWRDVKCTKKLRKLIQWYWGVITIMMCCRCEYCARLDFFSGFSKLLKLITITMWWSLEITAMPQSNDSANFMLYFPFGYCFVLNFISGCFGC